MGKRQKPDFPKSFFDRRESLLDKKIKKILEMLKKRGWHIGVMESCTGGAIANCLTNIPGSSDVFRYSLVTYCDESKIKAGVDKRIIKRFGVYSVETAREMAKKIKGNVGVGITGNLPGEVFMAVRVEDQVKDTKLKAGSGEKNEIEARRKMKDGIVEKVIEMINDNI